MLAEVMAKVMPTVVGVHVCSLLFCASVCASVLRGQSETMKCSLGYAKGQQGVLKCGFAALNKNTYSMHWCFASSPLQHPPPSTAGKPDNHIDSRTCFQTQTHAIHSRKSRHATKNLNQTKDLGHSTYSQAGYRRGGRLGRPRCEYAG